MPDKMKLYEWCKVRAEDLAEHPDLKVPFRMVADSAQMGLSMAEELLDVISANNEQNKPTRAIIPCGPKAWYSPFGALVNERRVSLGRVQFFHMDECLDWQGRVLPKHHPYNFRTEMETMFYAKIDDSLNVPEPQRVWLTPENMEAVRAQVAEAPIDIALGGWGQDGHLAYNQARRHPFSEITLDELRASSIRIQENNWDTVITLAHRTFGAAYQFVPPMSVTLGMKEVLSAKKVRVFSDTGSWKQTALRVALFSEPTTEYPITLLQEHTDARITATRETAEHPISSHLEWELF